MKHALVVTEARGQAIHLREDANINLLQAGYLARTFARNGFATRIRLILDGGQSPEEYSLLCHLEDDAVEALRRTVSAARDPARARRQVVGEVRERYLAVTLRARYPEVADDLFFAPVLSEVSGINPRLRRLLMAAPHPWIDRDRIDEYEELLVTHRGASYLDLEEGVARHALARTLDGEAAAVEIAALRPSLDPQAWFRRGAIRTIVESDLREKERGGPASSFHARLIGIFPAVRDTDGRCYFNSPTSCRLEHGKVRILPRDRFGILDLQGSERLPFSGLRTLLDEQVDGGGRRLVGMKYPYTARFLAGAVAREAADLAQEGPTKVVFIEGSEGTVNPATGGLLDALLSDLVTPFAEYHRFVARDAVRKLLPVCPGGLPLIQDALAPLAPESFWPPLDTKRLFADGRPRRAEVVA